VKTVERFDIAKHLCNRFWREHILYSVLLIHSEMKYLVDQMQDFYVRLLSCQEFLGYFEAFPMFRRGWARRFDDAVSWTKE
jgi:hypothetical protein